MRSASSTASCVRAAGASCSRPSTGRALRPSRTIRSPIRRSAPVFSGSTTIGASMAATTAGGCAKRGSKFARSTMRPVSARRSGGATHCPTTGSTSCAGPLTERFVPVRRGRRDRHPTAAAALAGRHRMNVWLEKSVCLISTLEWNNLPPRFFAEKVAESGKLFRIFVITNPKPPSLMERSRRRVLSPMPMGPIRRSGRPRHLPPHFGGAEPFAAVFPAADRAANSLNP